MTGFLLTAKQKLMLCINKRLYRYRGNWPNGSHRSDGSNRNRSNRSNGSYRPDGSNRLWSNRSNGSHRSDGSNCPVNICTTRKMP